MLFTLLVALLSSCDEPFVEPTPDPEPDPDPIVEPTDSTDVDPANGYAYVDLGLPSGTLWATCNVGAVKPEGFGYAFAWGETEIKSIYDWSTYKWCNGGSMKLTKYCLHPSNGTVDGVTTLEPADDAAHVNMGGDWRMPSTIEFDELKSYCLWTFVTQDDTKGYKVVGPNGNSIFLPTTGYRSGNSINDADYGEYWTSTIASSYSYYANRIHLNSTCSDKSADYRCYGRSVRAVRAGDTSTNQIQQPAFEGKSFTLSGITFNMVLVEGGTFTMGAVPGQESIAMSDENPAHEVTLKDFFIGETEVTQDLWIAVMENNPSSFKNNGHYPVENISKEDCEAFIDKLNSLRSPQMKNYYFALPTEAQWEYAARGGNKSKSYKYSGSNTVGDVAWYKFNSNAATHPVATKQPNELGIYDMSGNVNEWCSDWYGPYSPSEQTNPIGSNSGTHHLFRGGDWEVGDDYCRVSSRHSCYVGFSDNHVGLRLVLKEIDANGHEWVDLGLSSGTLWATCNVGASTPEEYGDYFAWGETETKEVFDYQSYKWGIKQAGIHKVTKYCIHKNNGYVGYTDGDTILYLADDAARANMGGDWRMPTYEELMELFKECVFGLTTQNGIYGLKIYGPNHKSIFLPAAGSRDGSKEFFQAGSEFCYWSSTLSSYGSLSAFAIHYMGGLNLGSNSRTQGCSLRGVLNTANDPKQESGNPPIDYVNGHEYVDLGLPSGLLWATCNVGATTPEGTGDYFSWGELWPKTTYDWNTYKWCNGTYNTFTKYCNNSAYGEVDNKTSLDIIDDAAHINMGGGWRMPTRYELEELVTNCTWTRTSIGIRTGYKVVGPNGNAIFLPTPGSYSGGAFSYGHSMYWSSSLEFNYNISAGSLNLSETEYSVNCSGREGGRNVRGVLDPLNR